MARRTILPAENAGCGVKRQERAPRIKRYNLSLISSLLTGEALKALVEILKSVKFAE